MSGMRVVLLEDDAGVASFLRQGLADEGIDVEWFADGETGAARLREGRFDVAIVDVMLPRLDGLAAIAAARAARVRSPVLVLSARDGVEDRVRGLDLGADDYLIKPFAFAELLARLRALVRRVDSAPAAAVTVGRLQIEPARHQATVDGSVLALSPTELALVTVLARSCDEVVARKTLLREVWGYHFDPGTNVIDVHVGHLRRKLEAAGAGVRIPAVRGVGYKLVVDDA